MKIKKKDKLAGKDPMNHIPIVALNIMDALKRHDNYLTKSLWRLISR